MPSIRKWSGGPTELIKQKKNFDSEIPWRWYLRFTISGIWISNTTVMVFQNQNFQLNQFSGSSWAFMYTWRLWNTNKSALNTGIWISNTTDGGIWISNTNVMVFQNKKKFPLNQFSGSSWAFMYTWCLWNTNKSALNTGIWISNTTDGEFLMCMTSK